jgi:hypothetical protein
MIAPHPFFGDICSGLLQLCVGLQNYPALVPMAGGERRDQSQEARGHDQKKVIGVAKNNI